MELTFYMSCTSRPAHPKKRLPRISPLAALVKNAILYYFLNFERISSTAERWTVKFIIFSFT